MQGKINLRHGLLIVDGAHKSCIIVALLVGHFEDESRRT
jgi:hypothetical protein